MNIDKEWRKKLLDEGKARLRKSKSFEPNGGAPRATYWVDEHPSPTETHGHEISEAEFEEWENLYGHLRDDFS